ncbi:MAG: efflux RND transporter permease subunit [Firmicutes bacterium]|nr:efflux RND transporter permease subunit [Bacillota bacterium]
MRFLTRFSLRNPVVIFILAILVAVGGLVSSTSLQEELMPNISFPVLGVLTTYPGASPEVVAHDVTEPLEKAIQGIAGVQNVMSTSVQNVSEVEVELSLSADINSVQQKVQQAVNQVTLPASATTVDVQQFSFNSTPIMYYTVASKTLPFGTLKNLVQNTIIPGLQGVPGVGSATTTGASPDQVVIQFNESKLTSHHLTAAGVLQDLQADNISMPLGSSTIAGKVQPVQLAGAFTSIAQIRNLAIPVPPSPTAGFTAIGSTIGKIGHAVGQLAQGEGQLAQGENRLGQGEGKLAQGESKLASGEGQLGKGVGQVGQAVGKLGQAVGQEGQGLQLLEAQNQLLTGITAVQGQIMGVQMALAQEYAKPASSRNSLKLLQYAAQIQSLEQEEQSLFGKLKQLSATIPSGKTGGAGFGQPGSTSAGASPGVGSGQAGSGVGTSTFGGASSGANGTGAGFGSGSSTAGAGGNAATFTSGQHASGIASPSSPSLSAPKTSATTTIPTIPLSDLATVNLQPVTDGAINRTNGERSVLVSVVKTDNANTVTTAQGVVNQMQQMEASFPAGVHVTTLYDGATSVVSSINGMLREAILGAIFAAIVILLFLRNGKTTLIAIVSIPVSLLIALIFLNQFNVSLNIMTLGGMAVATGRVVDDSIVVIENIYRSWKRGSGFGKGFVLHATAEVGRAITSSTITTIAVFVPLGLVSGIVGKVFFPFAVTVVFSLISSLFVALTIVPLLAWLLIARKAPKGLEGVTEYETGSSKDPALEAAFAAADDEQSHSGLRPWQRGYQRTLSWCLNHKGTVILVTVLVFLASTAVLPLVGSTFLPQEGDQYATVSVKMPVGTTLALTDAKARQIEAIVGGYKGTVVDDNLQVGSDPAQYGANGPVGTNQANFFIKLSDTANVNDFVSSLRQKVAPISGPATVQVGSVTIAGSGGGFDLIVTGPNLPAIKQAAVQITNRLHNFPGLANVQNNLTATQPQVTVVPNMAVMAKYELSPYQISGVVKNYLSGQNVGNVTLGNTKYPLVAQVQASSAVVDLAGLTSLPIQAPTGQNLTLGDVASVSIQQTPVAVLHRNGNDYAEVSGDFTSQNTGSTTKQALKAIAKLPLPAGIGTSLSGSSQEETQSFTELIEAVLVAAGMVYIVMLIAFGEWVAPFAILFSMPVALIGAFLGTWIGHQPISVSSLIGILMLMGIVVTNAIVLISRVEQQRERGLSVREALLEAGTTRLRPILMTAIATICALAPLASGLSEGALISQGLAVVVIGGLVTSTVLTLVIVPLVYELLHRGTIRREKARISTRQTQPAGKGKTQATVEPLLS